ncbi:MAG: winged helix-turn-helix domain-containing protein [Alphaproteobacteria bacterium]|nr:winged helix-turn-helix domain-containing protein [Alphaproteobacteria bacterium]
MTTSEPILALDAALAHALGAAGLRVRHVADADGIDLTEVSIVAMGPDWARLEAWRVAGHRVGALVLLGGAPEPEARAVLEPLVIARDARPETLRAAVARLEAGRAARQLRLGPATVDLGRRLARVEGVERRLSQLEADLLAYLAARPNRDVSREELQLQVWGHHRATSGRSVDMAVSRLRRKIEPDPAEPQHLLTVRGGGYRLVRAAGRTGNLPAPRDAFVGREGLIAELEGLLEGPERLLTLVGPPGAGKTRLALALARRAALPGGAWRCELVGVEGLDELALAVSRAMQLSLGDTGEVDPLARLTRALAHRGPTLLVLDNAEHLTGPLGAAAGAWLAGCPAQRLVVTSRVRLGVGGERVVAVPPLTLAEARALFMTRAASAGAEVEAGPLLDTVVALLDRLPLAIELAAARVRALGMAALRDHLDARFRLLRGGPAADPRHRTLHAAIAWSWGLLALELRAALTALSVFVGGFHAEAAAAVLGLDALDTLDALEALVDRSLVQPEGDRYRMLESIRSFAGAHGDPGGLAEARRRHAGWFAALAARWSPQWGRSGSAEALRRLSAEAGNLAAAWEASAAVDARAEITLALDVLHEARGTFEGRLARLDPTIAAMEGGDPALLTRLRYARGAARLARRDLAAEADLRAAAEGFAALGRPWDAGRATNELAYLHHLTGRSEEALALCDHGLAVHGFPLCHSLAANIRINLGREDDVEAAFDRMHRTIDALEAAGRVRDAVSGCTLLLDVLLDKGRLTQGISLVERAEGLQAQLPGRHLEGVLLYYRSRLHMSAGRNPEALALLDAAWPLVRDSSPVPLQLVVLKSIGIAAAHGGAPRRAVRSFQEARAVLQRTGDTRREALVLTNLATAWLDLGDLRAAERALEDCDALLAGASIPSIERSATLLRACARILEGRPEAAVAPLASLDLPAMIPYKQAFAHGLRGAIAAWAGLPSDAADALEAVLRQHEVSSAPHWWWLLPALRAGHQGPVADVVSGTRVAHALVRLVARALPPPP